MNRPRGHQPHADGEHGLLAMLQALLRRRRHLHAPALVCLSMFIIGVAVVGIIMLRVDHAPQPHAPPIIRQASPASFAEHLQHIKEEGLRQIDRDPKTAVLIISQGRSGSTALMQAFGKYAFLIPEPYRNWYPPNITIDGDDSAAVTPDFPTMEELFNCSFILDRDKLHKVFWEYACANSFFISKDKHLRKRCTRSAFTDQDMQQLHESCRTSRTRVIKTIRFHMNGVRAAAGHSLVENLQSKLNMKLRIIHLKRSATETARSQFVGGWWPHSYNFSLTGPAATEAMFNIEVDGLCNKTVMFDTELKKFSREINDEHESLHNTSTSPLFYSVYFDDFAKDNYQVLSRLFRFVGLTRLTLQFQAEHNREKEYSKLRRALDKDERALALPVLDSMVQPALELCRPFCASLPERLRNSWTECKHFLT
eukprot:m.61344 g.61344  ORF g.61344 m.61344 type:complete len:424 (-) comp13716_c0_seq2:503-1774(-)